MDLRRYDEPDLMQLKGIGPERTQSAVSAPRLTSTTSPRPRQLHHPSALSGSRRDREGPGHERPPGACAVASLHEEHLAGVADLTGLIDRGKTARRHERRIPAVERDTSVGDAPTMGGVAAADRQMRALEQGWA